MNLFGIIGPDLSVSGAAFKETLLISLLSVWVLVGVFFYLNRYTRRRYFALWAVVWLFYALWLTLTLMTQNQPDPVGIVIWKQWCVGVMAVFLLWGSVRFIGMRAKPGPFGWFIAFLLAWSVAGAFRLERGWQFEFPLFTLVGMMSLVTSWCFYQYRRTRGFVGAGMLMLGFLLWGLFFASYPFFGHSTQLAAAGFLVAAILQIFIAFSMIVLMLEEFRNTNLQAFEQILSHKNLEITLRSKVISTEERYRSLFDQASEAIIIASAQDSRILELNETAQRLLGVNRAEASQQALPSFVQGHRLRSPFQPEPRWFENICQKRQLNLVRHNGGVTPVEVDGAPIDFEGRPAYQFFFREVTERSRLEQQLRQAEKLSALGQVISGVAHELNNPLTVIKGYLELVLARHELNPQTRGDLQKVAHESQRAAKLVRNFLAFAREQPGPREMINCNEIIQRVAELRKFDLLVAAVELTLDLAPGLPASHADGDQLQQVIINLVNNSLQALVDAPQPRKLRVRTVCRDGQMLQVWVEDNGPGVPRELEARIFEPFFTTKEVGTGTGLGLSIAHSILADHRGRIFYQTSELGGAAFVMEFPVMQGSVGEAPGIPEEKELVQGPALGGPAVQILVLDDERSIAELLCEMLAALGHNPTLCLAAPKALELLEKRKFDLIISDFRMPVMNGQEFYERLQERSPGLAAKIVFLTGDVVNEETQSFLKSTGNPHLAKPFQMANLERVLGEVLARERQAPGTAEPVSMAQ